MTTQQRLPLVRRWLLGSALALAGWAMAQPKTNEPAHGWIPTPSFTSPSMQQKFALASTLSVSVKAEIASVKAGGYAGPGLFDFVAYAKASTYTEKWHIHVVKQGPGGSELLLQKFEGLITGPSFSVVLDGNWFAKHGPGKYGARGFVSQATSTGMDQGLTSAVGFEVPVAQILAKQAHPKIDTPVARPLAIAASAA